jgi:hypothetical protein
MLRIVIPALLLLSLLTVLAACSMSTSSADERRYDDPCPLQNLRVACALAPNGTYYRVP